MSAQNRIIGIDPGFGRTGYGIVEKQGSDWIHVAHGCIETKAGELFVDRLDTLHTELKKILDEYKPNQAAVEELFFSKNVKTATDVGQARGVILLTLRQIGLPIDEFKPNEVKQAVTGYGNADKEQMQKMVMVNLSLTIKPTPDDAADALAVALTCAATLKIKKMMRG